MTTKKSSYFDKNALKNATCHSYPHFPCMQILMICPQKIRKGNYPFRILTMCLTLRGTLYSLPYNFAIL